jgi:hypothetical protein
MENNNQNSSTKNNKDIKSIGGVGIVFVFSPLKLSTSNCLTSFDTLLINFRPKVSWSEAGEGNEAKVVSKSIIILHLLFSLYRLTWNANKFCGFGNVNKFQFGASYIRLHCLLFGFGSSFPFSTSELIGI